MIWKKSGEEKPIQCRQKRSVGKVMLVIFWDQHDVLLTDYLTRGNTVDGRYYATLIERLHTAILQNAVRQANFVELNHPSYSSDITPSDYHMFFHLKKFLRGKSFGSDDEVITTVDDYLGNLDSEFFFHEINSFRDRWQRVIANEDEYI